MFWMLDVVFKLVIKFNWRYDKYTYTFPSYNYHLNEDLAGYYPNDGTLLHVWSSPEQDKIFS